MEAAAAEAYVMPIATIVLEKSLSFGPAVKEAALLASGRHCCICHRFCGTKMECHHIVHESAGGKNDLDNCIPVCFDCHADMTSYDFKHPKGTKYTEKELRGHRDAWFQRVSSAAVPSLNEAHVARDRRVYAAFVAEIPYDPTIVYWRSRGFTAAFHRSVLEPLDRYVFYTEAPDKAFTDPDLESLRAAFVEAADRFVSTLAVNTWTLNHNIEYSQVPAEWEETNFARLQSVLKELHERYEELAAAYGELVRVCQVRLGV